MFGAADIAEEKASVDEYESGSTEEKVTSFSLYFHCHVKPSYSVYQPTIIPTLIDLSLTNDDVYYSL